MFSRGRGSYQKFGLRALWAAAGSTKNYEHDKINEQTIIMDITNNYEYNNTIIMDITNNKRNDYNN